MPGAGYRLLISGFEVCLCVCVCFGVHLSVLIRGPQSTGRSRGSIAGVGFKSTSNPGTPNRTMIVLEKLTNVLRLPRHRPTGGRQVCTTIINTSVSH